MVTDGIMDMIRLEIDKTKSLKADMERRGQPDTLIAMQQGVIDGLELAETLLGDYAE